MLGFTYEKEKVIRFYGNRLIVQYNYDVDKKEKAKKAGNYYGLFD